MADRVVTLVAVTPIETLTDENSGTHDIIASEVKKLLGGSAETPVTDFSGTGTNQGYTGGAAFYREASYNAGGTKLTGGNLGDFFFIKNTGYRYSSSSVLGAASTDCVIIAAKMPAHSAAGSGTGGFLDTIGTERVHYIEIATLKPGQAILLPSSQAIGAVSQFGSYAGDMNPINQTDADGYDGGSSLYVKTIASTGADSTASNAVEFLAVS